MKTKTVLAKIGSLFNKKGFTLIELLVVIAIIAVLIAVGLAAFGTAQKNTRDSRRKSDMKSVQAALEQYFSNNSNSYPIAVASISSVTYFQSGTLPVDPKNTSPNTYNFVGISNANSYTAYATLEVTNMGNFTDSGCTTPGAGSFFCIRNSQ